MRPRRAIRGAGRSAGAIVVFTLAGGCGAAPATDADPSTLTIHDRSPEVEFGAQYFTPAKFMVFEPLVWFDEGEEPVPRLARSWEHSADFREWTYHLRPDVRWHDGAPVTSRDVKFTVELFASPDIGYYWDLEEARAPDDSTIVIRTSRPRGEPDGFTAYYPEHLLGDLDPKLIWEWDFWRRPVGNGPFRFRRHVPLTLWELEANPDYYAGRPRIERVRIRFGGGDPLVELLSGSADALASVDRALLPKIEADGRFRVYYRVAGSGLDAIWWNHRHPFLRDARVRRALTLAVDRRELRGLLNLPDSLPLLDVPVLSPRQLLADDLPPPLPHDLEGARRLLEDAGWFDADGDGVRERGGERAAFTALAGPGHDFAAVYVQAALEEIGVRMDVRRTPTPTGPYIIDGAYEAAFERFLVAQADRLETVGYENPGVREIASVAQKVADPAVRDSLARELWPHFLRDVPVMFLGPQVMTFVAHRRVMGLSSPFRANPYEEAWRLWIEEES